MSISSAVTIGSSPKSGTEERTGGQVVAPVDRNLEAALALVLVHDRAVRPHRNHLAEPVLEAAARLCVAANRTLPGRCRPPAPPPPTPPTPPTEPPAPPTAPPAPPTSPPAPPTEPPAPPTAPPAPPVPGAAPEPEPPAPGAAPEPVPPTPGAAPEPEPITPPAAPAPVPFPCRPLFRICPCPRRCCTQELEGCPEIRPQSQSAIELPWLFPLSFKR